MPATRSLAAVVRGLVPPGDGPTDADLVGRFAAGRDEAAFALLVRRHGPTVFGVCRRLLRHQQDAEDAFQAVFLVLARKAGSVGRAGAVGSWLYGVAVNVARKARAARLRRREVPWASIVEHRPGGLCHQDSGGTGLPACATQDLAEVIDRELLALPGKYRTAVVLCDLGGRTVREAAAEVGCPAKTLGTRLLRGRALLAARLSRRGVTLSAVGLAAAVPPRLSGSVLPLAIGRADVPPAVAALTHGAVSAMIPKTMAAAAVLAGGLLVAAGLAGDARGPAAPVAAARPAPAPPDPPAWAHFKKVAGDTDAGRALFAQMTADPARAKLLDRAAADPAVAAKRYADEVARLDKAWNDAFAPFVGQPAAPAGTESPTRKATDAAVPPADVLAVLFLGSLPHPEKSADPAEVNRTLEGSFIDLVNGPQKAAARKLFAAWLDKRRDPGAVRAGLDGALYGAIPEAVPAARRWLADPKVTPGVAGTAALVLGNHGAAADLPRLAKLRDDARNYLEYKTVDGAVHGTQVRDVTAAMSLLLRGEDFEKYGFDRVEHYAAKTGKDPAPFQAITCFEEEKARAAALKKAWDWLDAQPKPDKK